MANQKIPDRIGRLEELAYNLWWSWHDEPHKLFRSLDYPLWRASGHNPVKQLREISPDTLKAAAGDPTFLELYDSVMSDFDTYMKASNTWFGIKHCRVLSGPVAYFSMEYAIHNSLPIYAGGLGILAGDICKEASDLGLPLVAIGFMYPQGYFNQHVSKDGWQQEVYRELNFDEAPISRVLSPKGETALAEVQLGDVTLAIGVWKVQVGCTNVYLLDTNLDKNPPQYRQLSARLYIADRELRLQQEIIIGIGGVRVLRALGINPGVWHANEGHTAFMMLERVRGEVAKGSSFAEAINKIRASTVFTTHTPVLAGHDIFPVALLEKYFSDYWRALGIGSAAFLQLGQQDRSDSQTFNMAALAMRLASQRSAVSQLHEKVTKRMWHGLWPEVPEEQVPISHVTNGIHLPTWIAPEIYYLFVKYLGRKWIENYDDSKLWEPMLNIPDEELWAVRHELKHKLLSAVLERAQERWAEEEVAAEQVLAMGGLLNPDALTIGFVRRFTEYKRPALVFRDVERLKQIVQNQLRPVQIIFAGKSHPADFPSKFLLHQVYTLAKDRTFRGRIVFVEDYDMDMAHYLVQGVDVWLNTPRRLQEACGSSGMKASLNGVLHLSVKDGWWHEGYNSKNGWAIGDNPDNPTPEEEDKADAEALYRLLEEEIVPIYYTRDRAGVPHEWLSLVKESIRSIAPVFCARRMVKEYAERMYKVAAQPT